MSKPGRYRQIIEDISTRYQGGVHEVEFDVDDIRDTGVKLGVEVPDNPPDVPYQFRFRRNLPPSIRETAPEGKVWIIRLAGFGKYRFVPVTMAHITPTHGFVETKIPDSTPGLVGKYSLTDEQALLARVRYNRLIDIFTGVASYSLQNHLRSRIASAGNAQTEIDELYVGVDRRGRHYVFPVQAKGGKDKLAVVQVEQDLWLCQEKFPELVCRPIAAQFMANDLIALFELEDDGNEIRVAREVHYKLVPFEQIQESDLRTYRARLP